ncbi:MAG TPA: hypothetical protein VGM51_18330 [Armatimonadota bacterium]|jgi:hypothetical protein
MKVRLLTSLAALAICAASRAQVTVDLDNGSINGLANSLTQQSKVRILVGPGVAGRVTLHLHGVPLEAAVKTAAAVLDVKWRTLWLGPEIAPRIRPDQAARLASTIDTLATVPMAVDNGTRTVAIRAAPDEAPAKEGLRPVFIFLPKFDPANAASAPAAAPPPDQPVMAPTNDPEVMKMQRSFGTLSPEQQRTFINSIRSYWRPSGGGRGNAGGGQNRRNRLNGGG